MKVFLGGTVNGSKWRSKVKEELIIDYFDPVVDDWNDAAYERELSERRNCDYLLYVLTPKMTGYYAVAEVTDDSYRRPDRTLYCYLPEDDGEKFTPDQIEEFEMLGKVVSENGAKWLKNLDEIISFLNSASSVTKQKDEEHYDVFISYGRRESMQFANKISNRLSELNYKVFHDIEDIPLMVDNEDYVYQSILKSDNFIYIISPNAIRSEYCQKELDFAIRINKRIIPIVHIELNQESLSLDDIIAKKKAIEYKGDDKDMERIVDEIKKVVEKDRGYIRKHSKYMFKARQWEFGGRPQGELLYGEERKDALAWLNTTCNSIVPLQIHHDFILASKNLSVFMLPLLWLYEKTKSFTDLKWFDKVTLIISLGNPIALFDQLRSLIFSNDPMIYHSISIPMWMCFLIIQTALAFVGIKSKDLGLFISMLLSMVVSSSVIMLVLLNT